MSYPYATWIKGIKDALVDMVEDTTSFREKTSADFVVSMPNPAALVRLRRDTVSDPGPVETRHLIEFVIQVQFIGTHEESTLDTIIDYVGEIVDELETDRTLGSSYVLNAEVDMVDYTFSASESAIRHNAHITVIIECLRNV